jgi:pimeloyl-ACP methyl ester carboxylesterase
MARLAEVNRSARQEVIEGAGHGLTYTHSDAVLAALRDLMRD